MHSFERAMLLRSEDIDFSLNAFEPVPWQEFLLNPRRLRGSDFLMRWSQGVWSEQRMLEAVNSHGEFYAIPYGPSSVAPQDDVRAFELYFIRLEEANLGKLKRPDLLIFKGEDRLQVDTFVNSVGGASELPFISEDKLRPILDKAIVAIECENSLWVASKMKHFNTELKPQKWLDGQLGLPKTAVTPTVIIKEEDRWPLLEWQKQNNVPIHIWHNFFDRGYGLSLNRADELFRQGLIRGKEFVYQAPNGASTTKMTYFVYHRYAYELAESAEAPTLTSAYIEDKNGHILPYVSFTGGTLTLNEAVITELRGLKNGGN